MLIKLTNNFHNTSANVRVSFRRGEAKLSRRQVARVRRALCPVTGCRCGETMLKTRGAQRIEHPNFEPGQGLWADLMIYEAGSDAMDKAIIELT
jgi:hypothetical protein